MIPKIWLYLSGRKTPPSQYTFKIKSFSWLSKASVQKCTSEEFEAGGYKWYMHVLLPSMIPLHNAPTEH